MTSSSDLGQLAHDAAAATWTFTAISTILFFMRTFSRLRLHREALGWDDLVITISWMLNICRASFLQTTLNTTHKVISAPDVPALIASAAFWALFTSAWSYLTIALPKLGVGILICRLFRPQRWLRAAILTFCIVLSILAICVIIVSFKQCHPVAGQWNPFAHPDVRCWNPKIQLVLASTTTGFSAFADLAFTIYPIIVIWNLQMPVENKISAMALMSLGVASFAFAIVKLYCNILISDANSTFDILYACIRFVMWSSIENDFVLSAACLPASPPFFRACKRVLSSQITQFSSGRHTSDPISTTSYKSFKWGGSRNLPGTVELTSKDEALPSPGFEGIKVGVEISRTSNYI
ncbi:hypothetical protein NUU61_008607 [Penicillium alfredii]|uniref:Rhodopsin domain-containing protein n=1 Tax=Penicillium alfredii TaxID=1506179 RepID=A0A9W9JWD8_9EURO|nr:uncharacterized protein NUU61_008607 [Penicillium alfredii]KAJ5084028.1 hypothetical protein NUU61_008607 [Penicillium alfredii]